MDKTPDNFNPSLIRHTKSTLQQELNAWRGLVRAEWHWILLLGVGILLLLIYTKPLPQRDIYLAVGQHGTKFEALGRKFVPYFNEQGLNLHLVNTNGSAASLAELADTNTDIDAALLVAGVAEKGEFTNLASLGSIEYIPLWVFYRGGEFSGKSAYDFFATQRVAIGNPGSASESVLKKTLALSGITLHSQENFFRISDQEAVEKIINGEIDAICIMDSINAPNVKRLLEDPNLRILNFPHAAAYVKKLPFFNTVVVPMGSINLKENIPSKDITMLASTGTLLVEKNLHPVIQQTFLLAAEAISKQDEPFFSNPEFFPAYIDHTIPISPIAQKFYEDGPPSLRDKLPLWLINYVDRIWFLLLGSFAIIYPLFKLFPSYRSMRSKMLIEDAYEKIQQIDRIVAKSLSVFELQALVDQLDGLADEIRRWSISSEEMNRLYTMKGALNLIRVQALNKLQVITSKKSENDS